MWTLLLILLWSSLISASQIQMPQELYMNRLNMSFGINYKFNGLFHHNLERVWVVTKIAIPKLEDIHFPNINFDPDCKFTRKLNNARQAAKYEIQSICKSMKPLIRLLKQKEMHYENAIKALLKEEIPCMNQGTLNLVETIRYLSLLVRDFHMTLGKERCQFQYARRKQHLL